MEWDNFLTEETVSLKDVVNNLKTKKDLDDYIGRLQYKSFKDYFYNIINGDR